MTVRRAWLWIVGAVVADGILRLRFLNVPLSVDEAGYGQVTRLWARGFALYGDVAWVDRPQGLLGLYRLALMFGDEWAIRMLALKAGIALVLALAVIGFRAFAAHLIIVTRTLGSCSVTSLPSLAQHFRVYQPQHHHHGDTTTHCPTSDGI